MRDGERDPKAHAQDLPVLERLKEGRNVSQRSLARSLDMAASQVNRRIRELLDQDMIRVVDDSVRPYAYVLTPRGKGYRRRLLHHRFHAVVDGYQELRDHIRGRLQELTGKGMTRLVFYGAGDVLEAVLPVAEAENVEVVALVDDDPDKQGSRKGDFAIQEPDAIRDLGADAILITTFRHSEAIRARMGQDHTATLPVLEL